MADSAFPTSAQLACLRGWYEGLGARQAVHRYLGNQKADGQSSRAIIGRLRESLSAYARARHRPDLAKPFECKTSERVASARAASDALLDLERLPDAQPLITDPVGTWLPSRTARALEQAQISTLADLTVRVPRRRQWWKSIEGLGQAGAKSVEAFFAQHPELTRKALDLVQREDTRAVVPWERLQLEPSLDGSCGKFRAPQETCVLDASRDLDALRSWVSMHESPATQRAYRKEAERLMLWSVVELHKPVSSLTTEDAILYRTFLRDPRPASKWIGASVSRASHEWRPFNGRLSPRSVAYAVSVLAALFRWLVEKC